MAVEYDIIPAVAGTKNKASVYNENFAKMKTYVDTSVAQAESYVDSYMPEVSLNTAGKFMTNDGEGSNWAFPVAPGIRAWFSGDYPPDGWLVCDGAEKSRADYSNLFSAIGTKYGEGDGETTFNLPDGIGSYPFIEGSDAVGTKKNAGLPNITGRFRGVNSNTGADGCFYNATNVNGAASGDSDKYIYFDASRSNSIYGSSSTVQPASTTQLPIIKY